MSDIYRKTMDKIVGKGGVRCYCCNHYTGKDKPVLGRLVRRALKQADTKDVLIAEVA